MSSNFTNLKLDFATIFRADTVYNRAQNLIGFWGSDIWENLDVNNPLTTELSFFVVTDVDTVLDTFGYAEVVGLGRPSAELYVPEGS